MDVTHTRFDGGVAEDARNASGNQYGIAHHFDVSKPHKLIPYRDMENEAGSLSAYAIKSVCLFTDSAGTQAYFALGNVSGQTYPQFLEKSSLTGTFATSTSGAGAAGAVLAHTMIGYKKQNKLYCMKTSGSTVIVDSYDPAADSYTSTVGTISASAKTGIYPRPIVHPLDDIVYFFAGNIVAKLDNATFTATAVTLPAHLNIVSATDFGPYIAITCIPIDAGGKSVMFLWGRDTSLVEMDEAVDVGEGAAMICENVQGRVITISAPTYAAGTAFDFYPTITFRVYAGGSPSVVHEMRWEGSGTPTTLLKNLKAKHADDLYFVLNTYLENKVVNQIWRCGFNKAGEFFVTPDRLVNNDTALTGSVDGFDIIGNVLWAGYNGDGSLKRTNDQAEFAATSILESETMRSGLTEGVVGASVHFEPLPASGQVVLKYRTNENTSWTTVFTHTTDNSLRYDANAEMFTDKQAKEWHLRIESTGGAVITGWEFHTKPLADKPYA